MGCSATCLYHLQSNLCIKCSAGLPFPSERAAPAAVTRRPGAGTPGVKSPSMSPRVRDGGLDVEPVARQ